MRHAVHLRQTLFALLGLTGCAAAKPESTTSGSGDDPKPPVETTTSTSTGESLAVQNSDPSPADPDKRSPPMMEARRSRVCSVAASAANGAKVLQCREVLAQTPKSSLRACADNSTCDRGEYCMPDENGKSACIHLVGQTPDCASDLDCAQGTRCVLDQGSLTHGQCTQDACGTCSADKICAPIMTYDSAMDDFGGAPGGPPVVSAGFRPAGLQCMPAAASTLESQSPPEGMCHVSIHTSCQIVSGDWQCTYSGGLGRHPCGRPLRVDGEARTAAPSVDAPPSRALVARVRAIAFDEHASVVAFARVITQLAALGAPLDLLRKTSGALADEIEHARLAFELLDELDPAARGERPGAFPAALTPLSTVGGDLPSLRRALLEDTILGGAIGESGSVLDAVELREGAPEPVCRFLDRVIADETRHAALAFETIAWLTAEDPSLREVARDVLSHETASPVVDRVVRPVLAALLS